MPGPLQGVSIVELAGIGPGPFAAMLLADMGADVVRVDRTQSVAAGFDPGGVPVLDRDRRSIGVDLKHADGVETVLRLVEQADALLEGFRPGVTERLGLGPDECLARNPRLVYGRMTGWGQDGPMADAAGHDINYIALGGALAHFGREGEQADAAGQPRRRLRWWRDAPRVRRRVRDPRGPFLGPGAGGRCGDGRRRRGPHVDDLGLPRPRAFDETRAGPTCSTPARRSTTRYDASDGKDIALGSLEPQFYAELLRLDGARRRGPARADGPRGLASPARTAHAGVRDQDA